VRSENPNWIGDGCSSILFHSFASGTNHQFITIDISEHNCEIARQHCPDATIICGDSVQELHKLCKRVSGIDLLYLDSYDLDWNKPHPSALHHMNELCAASPMLREGSIVFIDDNNGSVGKGMYIRQYMKQIGATQIWDDYLIGFILN
jgi:predicted O-methyltransferase YrrM